MPTRSFPRCLRAPLASCLIVAGTLLIAPAPAEAQYGGAAGFAEVMSPHYLRRDLRIFEDALRLDPAQAAILQSLFWDYESRHEASRQRMLEQIESLRDDLQSLDRTQQVRMIFEPFITQATDWEQQRTQFLQDVQYLLNERQQQEWPEFLMRLRREKDLPRGELAGERTDLLQIFRQLGLPPSAAQSLAPVLDGYAHQLDAALIRRERDVTDSRIALMTSMRDEDPRTALSLYRRQLDLRVAVRNVNDQYRDLIAAELPDEHAGRFRAEALESGYPRIYRPTPAQRVIDAALRLEDLDEAMQVAVNDLHTAFHAELFELNDRLLRALRDFEPRDAIRRAELSASERPQTANANQPARDDTQPLFASREQMSRRYVNMLQDILGDDLFLTLPGANRFFQSLQNVPVGSPTSMQDSPEHEHQRRGNERRRHQIERGKGIGVSGG